MSATRWSPIMSVFAIELTGMRNMRKPVRRTAICASPSAAAKYAIRMKSSSHQPEDGSLSSLRRAQRVPCSKYGKSHQYKERQRKSPIRLRQPHRPEEHECSDKAGEKKRAGPEMAQQELSGAGNDC